jgi:hypothetical protein
MVSNPDAPLMPGTRYDFANQKDFCIVVEYIYSGIATMVAYAKRGERTTLHDGALVTDDDITGEIMTVHGEACMASLHDFGILVRRVLDYQSAEMN